MLKDLFSTMLATSPSLSYHWKYVDGVWTCNDKTISSPFTLSDWLSSFGFEIPDYIESCVCSNELWHLTFNQFGNNIYIKLYQKIKPYEQITSSRN